MSNKFFNKQFFDGFSKVFKGPSDKEGFSSGKRFATIGGVKPKSKLSEATKTFKQKIKAIDEGLESGVKEFKTENPKRNITDEQMTKIKSDKKKELASKETKKFLREKKRKGGRIGFNKGTGRSGVPAMDIKTKISLNKKKKNKSKFPDVSGDGKITKKGTLMARGVIPKPKNKKKVI